MPHSVFTGPGLIHGATHTCPEDSRHRPAPGRICRSSSPSYKGALLPAVPSSLSAPMRASASEATLLPRQAHYVLCFCVTSGMLHDFNSQRGIYLFLITSKVILSLLFPPSMTQPLSPDFPFSLKQDVPTSSISLPSFYFLQLVCQLLFWFLNT